MRDRIRLAFVLPLVLAFAGAGRADDDPPSPAEAKAICETAGRADCDEVASWFEPLPGADAATYLQLADPGGGDTAEIRRLRGLACDGGDATACEVLGATPLLDPAGDADWARGMNLLDRACQLGAADACELHRMHLDDRRDAGGRGPTGATEPPEGSR